MISFFNMYSRSDTMMTHKRRHKYHVFNHDRHMVETTPRDMVESMCKTTELHGTSIGYGTVSSGSCSFSQGFGSKSEGFGSVCLGKKGLAYNRHQVTHSAGCFDELGDCQNSSVILKIITNDKETKSMRNDDVDFYFIHENICSAVQLKIMAVSDDMVISILDKKCVIYKNSIHCIDESSYHTGEEKCDVNLSIKIKGMKYMDIEGIGIEGKLIKWVCYINSLEIK